MNKRSQGEAFRAMKLVRENPNRDHLTVAVAVAVVVEVVIEAVQVAAAAEAVVVVNADLIAITDRRTIVTSVNRRLKD
jgi:hypothetical protein